MKLSDLSNIALIAELRTRVGEVLNESIAEYMAITLAKLKNKKAEEIFADGKDPEVDLDRLALYITGLKILGNSQYRTAITKDDVGINPTNAKELFKLLDDVPKDEKKAVKEVDDVFNALKSLSPSMFKKEREQLDHLISDSDEGREEVIKKLATFTQKINQIFTKSKASAKTAQQSASA